MALTPLLVLLAAGLIPLLTQCTVLADPVTVTLGGNDYRVHLLTPDLIRIERKGPHGFEDRQTFLVTNRSYPGLSFESDTHNSTTATLSTSMP